MANREKPPEAWEPDIAYSVADYNAWYLGHAPDLWATARGNAVELAAQAMEITDDFGSFTPALLEAMPRLLNVARLAVAPPWARDRLIWFAGVSPNVVKRMELDGVIPTRARDIQKQLQRICGVITIALDPGLFVWLEQGRAPTDRERDRALLLLGERLTRNFHDPLLKNAQEKRQKALMGEWLVASGFTESPAPSFSLEPGEFGMGRNVIGEQADGERQNLPTDCVIRPLDTELPLVCLEMKSAGDFTNVNKRKKEESDKHAAYRRAHGNSVVMLLQLFGYFDRKYLAYEAGAGLDWAWDHRLADFKEYVGL